MEGMRTCPACGAHTLRRVVGEVTVPFRKTSIEVPSVTHDVCDSCGEEPMSTGEFDALQKRAVALAREAKGLLTPDEIRELRRVRGLSQRQLERVLRVGEKTVVRWEKGTVFQNAGSDTLMRLIRQDNDVLQALLTTRADVVDSRAKSSDEQRVRRNEQVR